MREADIPKIIGDDGAMTAALRGVRSLNLPDWWIGAGYIRNKIWDVLHGRKRTPPGDIDVVYFDPSNLSEAPELELQRQLEDTCPTGRWSVTNQARMHAENGDAPYASSLDAIGHWPETATAIGVTLGESDDVIFRAVHGTRDLLRLVVRPTPVFEKKIEKYRERIQIKDWHSQWPRLKIEGLS